MNRAPSVLAAAALLAALPASAQTNERLYANLDFRFSTPGARAVGMGRSFVGLADDATATDVNPAGIVNLRETEVAMSYTVTRYQRDYFGTPPLQTSHVVQAPSFLSLVVPVGRVRFAAFQNTTQRFRDEFCVDQFDSAAKGNTSIDIANFGGAIAIETGHVSIGVSMAASSLDLAMHARSLPGRRCTDRPLTEKNGTDTFAASLRPKAVIGAQWWVNDRFAIGGAYHTRVTFPMTTTLTGRFAQQRAPDADRTGETLDTDYVLPTRFSAGVGLFAASGVVFVADWQRVRYSERVTPRFRVIDFQDAYVPENFYQSNANEIHAGVELRQVRPGRVLALRGGVFSDPDHAIRYRRLPGTPDDDLYILARFNARPPATDWGWSGGVSGAWRGRVQADVGISYVRDAFDVVVSAVFRLP